MNYTKTWPKVMSNKTFWKIAEILYYTNLKSVIFYDTWDEFVVLKPLSILTMVFWMWWDGRHFHSCPQKSSNLWNVSKIFCRDRKQGRDVFPPLRCLETSEMPLNYPGYGQMVLNSKAILYNISKKKSS